MEKIIGYKTLNQIAEVIVGIPEEKTKDERNYQYYYIQPSHLQDFNQINPFDLVFRSTYPNIAAFVKKFDILIKRLSPANINILTQDHPLTYVSSNIMIVRTGKDFDPKYVAGILENQGVPSLQHHTQRGAMIQTISKSELQNVKIPVLPLNTQKVLGEIWLLSKEKQKLLKKLADEEAKYTTALFNTLLR